MEESATLESGRTQDDGGRVGCGEGEWVLETVAGEEPVDGEICDFVSGASSGDVSEVAYRVEIV